MDAHPMRARDPAGIAVLEPLTGEVVAALRYFRGVCHRKQVIDYIDAAHRRAGQLSGAALAEAIVACFERHLGAGGDDHRPFRLPFGPGSHRWALSEQALAG
ncbi:MAG: hypothetical protein GC145_06885 [Caulobacter sp.]|nr:hypothetical protein [Caulobacter sp.]